MAKSFSKLFSADAESDQSDGGGTGGKYQPLGGDPSPPDDKEPGDEGPPPEIASAYPGGGESVDPGSEIA